MDRAIISGRQDPIMSYNYGPHLSGIAGGPDADKFGQHHEVLLPRWSVHNELPLIAKMALLDLGSGRTPHLPETVPQGRR